MATCMRIRFVAAAGTLAVLVCTFPGSALAQPGYPGQRRPTTSPYLNLLRRDNSPVLNYYGIVRPEIELRQRQAELGRGLQSLQTQVAEQAAALPPVQRVPARPVISPTGHPVSFNSLGGYFGGR